MADTNTNMTVATPSNYWISPNALHIERNAMSNPDYIKASCVSGAQILVHIKDIISYGERMSLTQLLKVVDSKVITITAQELAAISTTYCVTVRDELIVVLIRMKYTIDDELAVQRKAIQGNLTEFEEYSAFVQICKNLATAALLTQEQEDEA